MPSGPEAGSSGPQPSLPPPHPVRIRPRVRDCDRKRAARACWRCRDRKSRCVLGRKEGGKDVCQRCLKNGWDCVFGDIPDEALSNGMVMLSPQSERAPRLPDLAGDSRAENMRLSQSPSDGVRDEIRVRQRRMSEAARLVVKNKDPHRTHLVGEVSSNHFLTKVQDAVVADSQGEAQREMPSEHMLSLDANGTDDELLRIALDGFPPRNVADFLVDTFFHTVEANYYYMDRDRFKDRLQRCYADMTPEGVDHDASFVCLVLIVFAMGSQFADLRAPAQLISSMAVSKHGPGMVFYVKAKLLLSDVITTGSLESIQACFLIGLFLLPSNTSDLSYVYHGMALKMAISAGLHREIADASGLDQRVMHVRNRLWWSLYTSERRLTIILDRPESIREEDIDAPFPEFSPDLDPPHAGDNIYNLQASIQLTRIYNRAVRLGKAMDFADPKAEHSVADIRQDLENWARRLPSNLQLNKLSPEQKSFRGAVHLHMNYNQIVIYMGRAALLRRIQAHLHRLRDEKHSDSATPESAELNGRQEAEERLSQDCVNAAYRIIDYVRYLYELNRLARFSFTDFHCCTSAAIIVLIHEVIKRHPLFNTHIAAIMQCMQFMASGCENARISLRVIQNIHSTTTALKDKHPPAPLDEDDAGMENGDRSEETQRTGYEQWETWMSEARNWNISSRKETEVSRLAATTELTGGWRVEPAPLAAEYTDNAIGHQVNFGALSAGSPPFSRPGLPTGLLYNWPEDLNSLGLSAFGGLPFHAGTGM